MAKARKLSTFELNELSWQQKKRKKHSHGQKRGSRNTLIVAAKPTQAAPAAPAVKQVAKAIPIKVGGKELVNSQLPRYEEKPAHQAQANQPTQANVEWVVQNGQLVAVEQIAQDKLKKARQAAKLARQQKQAQKPAKPAPLTDAQLAGNKKLGKAQLRAQLRAEGSDADLAAFAKAQAQLTKVGSKLVNTKEDRSAVRTRDYKAGRNTDYVATQALAEKQLRRDNNKKLSGEELLDAWEKMSW